MMKLTLVNGLMAESNFGFRPSYGCCDANLILSRMEEDLVKYLDVPGIPSAFKRCFARLFDLRKAFPSADWRAITKVCHVIGFGKADKFWSALNSLHRCPLYKAGDNNIFTLENGVKEGDVGSPTLFIVFYSACIKAFRQFRVDHNLNLGVKLLSSEKIHSDDRIDDLKKLLYPLGVNDHGAEEGAEESSIIVDLILEILFADGTTILTVKKATR